MSSSSSIRDRLLAERRVLLDLGLRNRLLNTPFRRTRTRSLEIVQELSEQVYSHLVRERKSMSFTAQAASEEEADLEDDEADPESDVTDPDRSLVSQSEEGPRPEHADSRLQTRLPDEDLQRRLLDLATEAKTYEEEQGLNVLFLALGFLEWYEATSASKPRYAPLILVPVGLARTNVTSRFRVSATDADLSTNLTLQEKLKAEFGISLPDLLTAFQSGGAGGVSRRSKLAAHRRAALEVEKMGASAPIFSNFAGRHRSAIRHGVLERGSSAGADE